MTLRTIKIAGLALVLSALASAAAGGTWPYDGTGSQWTKPTDGSPPDRTQWIDFLRKSAAHGDNEALVNLASALEQGYPPETPDIAAALQLYEKAADQNDRYGRERMCVAYLLGEGRPADMAKAMGYCNKLPDTDPAGLFSAAFDYDHGISGPKDTDGAMAFYTQAIKAGSGEAMDAIGEKALAASNPSGARKWFRQAAAAGSADGMVHLAALLETGQGGDIDPDEAYWLYANADRRGNATATAWLAAQPAPHSPLDRVDITDGKTSLISQTISDAQGTRTVPFDIYALGQAMANYYPPNAVAANMEASVEMHCYIDGGNKIDLCLLEREYPVGYGFGALVLALYNGNLSVPAVNAKGEPTARKVVAFNYHWSLSH